MEELSITVRVKSDAHVVALEGSLDIDTRVKFKRVCAGLSSSGACQFIIDLSKLKYIDSSGVAAILMECRRVRVEGGTFAIVLPPQSIRPALCARGVDRLLPSYPNVEIALRFALLPKAV